MGFAINKNLITLKCVLFLVFGAFGSLLPFLPLHMNSIGLSKDESITIWIVAPLVALIGPLIAAPLSDRLAGGSGSSSGGRSKMGKYLRIMIALCLFFATIFYWLLLTVPPILRKPPNVTFMCDESGGFILQDRCGAERSCYDWNEDEGSVLVKNCIFTCNATTLYKTEEVALPYNDEMKTTNSDTNSETSSYDDSDYPVDATPAYSKSLFDGEVHTISEDALYESLSGKKSTNYGFMQYPHMCFLDVNGDTICEVYTNSSQLIEFNLGLKSSVEPTNNETISDNDVCRYPFASPFHCRITPEIKRNLTASGHEDCHPIVLCEIDNPYNNTNSLLKVSQCGYNNISFWLYLCIRSIADIFPTAAVVLLSTAVVIATRETSTGRGDIGKQFAAGALGFGLFALLIGAVATHVLLDAMICFTCLMVAAIIILLFDSNMPLSAPEWWWHTRCGLLALPMSSIRKFGLEIVALTVIIFLLGIFWNAIDAFLPWHIVRLPEGSPCIIGLTVAVGALPAVLYLIYAEKIVDYCGHSNILMICFVNYIIHHVALLLIKSAGLLLICEFLEIFTLHLMWITAVLYLRHLVPNKYITCGQALPIIAHFCLGRSIGVLLGSLAFTEYPDNFNRVHEGFTVAAAVIAIVYFVAYHFYLKPKAAPTQLPPYPAPSTVVQSGNGNGSYTPLRVYHNNSAKKGHFRY